MDNIIDDYQVTLTEAGCGPGSSRYGARLDFQADISPVMPYLNAVLENPRYDHKNRILILREPDQVLALRPNEIGFARVNSLEEARKLAAETVAKINDVWRDRQTITPRNEARVIPSIIEIFRRLPGTNCGACGCPTCLAFAARLSQGQALPDDCPPLSKEGQQQIQALFED